MTTDHRRVNKDLVHAFIRELFTKGDLDAVNRHLAPGFVNHDPPFPGAADGPEGMRQAGALFRRALPDWRSDLDRLIAEDDIVVERFTASGTHQGELMGVPAPARRSCCAASTSSGSATARSSNAGASSISSDCFTNSASPRSPSPTALPDLEGFARRSDGSERRDA